MTAIRVNPRALDAALRQMARRGEQDFDAMGPERQATLREIAGHFLRDYAEAKGADLKLRRQEPEPVPPAPPGRASPAPLQAQPEGVLI